MDTAVNPSRVSRSQSKKRARGTKDTKKLQDRNPKNSSIEPSNITFSITPVMSDKHFPKQPKLAGKGVKGPPADITLDPSIMNSPEEPPKLFPIKSTKSGMRKMKKPATAAAERAERHSAMPSKINGILSVKTCNSKQGIVPKEHVKKKAMKDPKVPLTSFAATVELVDLFSDPPAQESQATAPKSFRTPASSSKENEKSPKSRAIVPLVRLPQAASIECHSRETADVVDLNILTSHQGSSAGPSQKAQMLTVSPQGEKKIDEKSSDLAAQALMLKSRKAAPLKSFSRRRLILIDEDAESHLGESSSSALLIPRRSTPRTQRQKGNGKKSNQPASEIQSTENRQTPSGLWVRAEIAKNLAQVFATHQRLAIRNRSQKNVSKRQKFPFLRLPRELRDMIIDYAIDYDGIDPMLVKINATFPSTDIRSRKFDKKLQEWMTELDRVHFRSTPTVLLINQQIHEEAQEILRKKSLRISHPPQYPIKSIYDSSHVICDEAMSKICKIQFKLHTYPATERRHDILQPDWRGQTMYKDEFLANSYPWAKLLKDCFQVWRGIQNPRYLELSIDHSSGERSQFNLAVFGEKVRLCAIVLVMMFAKTMIGICFRELY